jgi:hypothetical protein
MARTYRVAAASVAIAALASSALAMGPAQAEASKLQYVEAVGSGVELSQILSSGDAINGYTWEGVPDGMGGVRNSDGTITVFVNHELSASDAFASAIERKYGGFGANISAVKYNPTSGQVVSVSDAFSNVVWYDYEAGKHSDEPIGPEDAAVVDAFNTPNHSTALNRFCAATMAASGELVYKESKRVKYFVKGKNGKKITKYKTVVTTFGTQDPIFLTGEEGSDESRAFALNTKTKQLAQLPALGLGAIENVVVAPASKTKKKTIAFIGEDGDVTDSQLFLYSGMKLSKGTWFEKAGLTNGSRYVAAVTDAGANLATDVNVRNALAKKSITSAVRGAAPVATTKVRVSGGTLTVTTAANHNLKIGDTVVLSDFGAVGSIDLGAGDGNVNGENIVRTVPNATSFTIGVDADDLAETAFTTGKVALTADTIVFTTSAAHGLAEGDQIKVAGNDLAGMHTVSGAPSTTVFTVQAEGAAFSITGGTVAQLLDVSFKKIPTNIDGEAQQVLARLRGTEFSRVEDLFVNPKNANEVYFITTQSDADGVGVAGVKETGRDGGGLWKMTFVDIANPRQGAYLELILDGSEASMSDGIKLNKIDNMSLTDNGEVVLLQEDPGANAQLARLLALRLSDNKLVTVARFKSELFSRTSFDTYLTDDEESSGVFDATKLFKRSDGASYFFFNAQVHPASRNGGGSSYGTDPLRALQVALARPDSVAQTSTAITKINRASSSATSITVTVSDLGALAVNDVIHIAGATAEINGSYAITGINVDAKTLTVAVANSLSLAGDLTVGSGLTQNARAISVNGDDALALKSKIVEGGALYTLKVTDWAAVFNVAI